MADLPLKPETLAAQALHRIDPQTGGLVPPIQPSTTYARDADYRLVVEGMSYSRDENPTYEVAEALLATLEGGPAARLFASGKAAAAAVLQALQPGDHVVAPRVMYWGLRNFLVDFAETWGLGLDLFDAADPASLAEAVAPGRTKLVWIETPSNPTWDVIDIAAAAAVARQAGARLAVDSTVATPVLTRPLALGADLVMHSATKYLNGHGDVVAGALVTAADDEFWARVCRNRSDYGAVLGPFEAWLLLRGLRTLYLRVTRASDSALAVARHFEGLPERCAVLYPGLESHPGHDAARRQMTGGFGGMLSLRVAGGAAAALEVAKRCRVFQRATSLGGVESLIEHRATIEGPKSPIPDDLLRLSIGIEHPDDLIADLEQALRPG
ncbi:MAG: PLP-dependent transferase [Rhodospirillales bacterium]|nr:PLP-dependent transferase [Rhodospirillales bacterium]